MRILDDDMPRLQWHGGGSTYKYNLIIRCLERLPECEVSYVFHSMYTHAHCLKCGEVNLKDYIYNPDFNLNLDEESRLRKYKHCPLCLRAEMAFEQLNPALKNNFRLNRDDVLLILIENDPRYKVSRRYLLERL